MSKLLTKEEQQVALALARNTLETALGFTDEKFTGNKNFEIFAEKRGVLFFIIYYSQDAEVLQVNVALLK